MSVSWSSWFLPSSGSPGPPIGLQTVSLKEQSVALQWSHGVDNHSPISKYTLQYRDAFSPEWRDAPTGGRPSLAPSSTPNEQFEAKLALVGELGGQLALSQIAAGSMLTDGQKMYFGTAA